MRAIISTLGYDSSVKVTWAPNSESDKKTDLSDFDACHDLSLKIKTLGKVLREEDLSENEAQIGYFVKTTSISQYYMYDALVFPFILIYYVV